MRTEPQDELRAIIEENLKISKKTLEAAEKTRRYIFMQSIGGWIRTILWLIPFALAAIFLPPYIAKLNALYQSLVGFEKGVRINLEDADKLHEGFGSIVNLQTR